MLLLQELKGFVFFLPLGGEAAQSMHCCAAAVCAYIVVLLQFVQLQSISGSSCCILKTVLFIWISFWLAHIDISAVIIIHHLSLLFCCAKLLLVSDDHKDW